MEQPSAQEHSLSARRAVVLFILFIALQFVVSFVISLPIGIYVGAAVELGHMDSSAVAEFAAQFDIPVAILSLVISALIIFQMTRRSLPGAIGRGAFASLGWTASSGSIVMLASGIGALIAAVYVFILSPAVPPVEGQSWGPLAMAADAGGWQRFYWAVLALLVAPPIEEFVFRGILFTGLSSAIGTIFPAIVVSALFVILHVMEAIHYWPIWIALILLAILTIILRIKVKSLLPCVAAHFSYNLVLVIVVYTAGA